MTEPVGEWAESLGTVDGVETVQMHGRIAKPLSKKLCVSWWFQGPDGWTVPTVNNGTPYLPDVTNVWLRRLYWFGLRNPMMNFVGFVIGVEDRNYSVSGSAPVLRTTGRDCEPQQLGWRWARLKPGPTSFLRYPYVSYWGPIFLTTRKLEFYLGWRPHSGGFGAKFVVPKDDASQM